MNFRRVLVFCAHADDEIIGPGGTLARLSKNGCAITLVVFTTGDTAFTSLRDKDKMTLLRDRENTSSCKILGIRNRISLGLPCQGVENDKATYQECVRLIRKYTPEAIFTHYGEDRHRDHRAISRITEEAWWKAQENVLANLGKPWRARHLYFYEIFELFRSPSVVCDISGTFTKKMTAMKSQKSQAAVLPGILGHIEGLAKTRGYACGTRYAEAFLESTFLPQIK